MNRPYLNRNEMEMCLISVVSLHILHIHISWTGCLYVTKHTQVNYNYDMLEKSVAQLDEEAENIVEMTLNQN
jgi:hypothetical protein